MRADSRVLDRVVLPSQFVSIRDRFGNSEERRRTPKVRPPAHLQTGDGQSGLHHSHNPVSLVFVNADLFPFDA